MSNNQIISSLNQTKKASFNSETLLSLKLKRSKASCINLHLLRLLLVHETYLETLTTTMQLLPSIRSGTDRDQLTITLMLRKKEKEEEFAKKHAIATPPSPKASTDSDSVIRSIKTGEYLLISIAQRLQVKLLTAISVWIHYSY